MAAQRPRRQSMAPARFKDSVVTKTLERVHQMKKATTFPYDLSALQWDVNHRENSSHTYCYCGKYGTWFKSMIQCSKCEQWFHERCLSPRPMSMPIMDGDPFYIFLCSVCNQGKECLKRIDFDLPDLIHLMLFNLTLSTMRKAHRYDQDILPYVESQWVMFQPPESLSNLTLWQREDRILDTLLKHKDRFGMLRQKRLESSVWWLNIVAPPPGPRFRVTGEKILTEKTILKEIYVGRYKTDPSKLECCLPNYLLNTSMPKIEPEKATIEVQNEDQTFITEIVLNSSSEESYATNTATQATDLNADKRRTRSSATSKHLCPDLTLHPNGEPEHALNEKPKKFKFPRVAMKFCSNQKIKLNREKNEEVIVSVPIPEEAFLVPATEPSLPLDVPSGVTVLDRFIPVPDSFSGLNNPFRLRDDKIREARKLICTRRLGVEDLTKTKKLKKRRRPLPLQESRLLWRQHLNPDQQDRTDQPSTSASSASSECSGNEPNRFYSRRKRKFCNGFHCNSNNNNNNNTANGVMVNNYNKPDPKDVFKSTKQMDSGDTETTRRIMTRNRVRELGICSSSKRVIGRRMIAPGVFEILVQHD